MKSKILIFALKHITWVIIVFLVGFILFQRSSSLRDIKSAWDTISNLQSGLQTTKDYASKLSAQLNTSKEVEKLLYKRLELVGDSLNSLWSKKMKMVEKTIDAKDEKIKGMVLLEAEYDKLEVELEATKTLVRDGEKQREKISFEKDFQSLLVSGYTLNNPPFAFVSVKKFPVALSVTITETKEKAYNVYVVSSDPFFKIGKLNSKFIGFREPEGFFSKLRKSPRVGLGVFDTYSYIKLGFQIYRFQPQIRLGLNGLEKGIEFRILN